MTAEVETAVGVERVICDLAHLGVQGYKKEAAVIRSYLYRIFR